MSMYDQYCTKAETVGMTEEQYIIPQSDAMARIMGGAKQIQLEVYKDAATGEIKLAVRSDGKLRIVAGDIATNSIKAIEKLSGRQNILRDFLQVCSDDDVQKISSDNKFDMTITAQSDGGYRMSFSAPDAKERIDADEFDENSYKKPSRYISRNDLKAAQKDNEEVA